MRLICHSTVLVYNKQLGRPTCTPRGEYRTLQAPERVRENMCACITTLGYQSVRSCFAVVQRVTRPHVCNHLLASARAPKRLNSCRSHVRACPPCRVSYPTSLRLPAAVVRSRLPESKSRSTSIATTHRSRSHLPSNSLPCLHLVFPAPRCTTVHRPAMYCSARDAQCHFRIVINSTRTVRHGRARACLSVVRTYAL